jgi:hypothetical protein
MEWIMLGILVGFVIGNKLGMVMEASLWRQKARPEYRTAQFSGGKFYYVISEHEYVEKML